mgnify:CR=1 FL=1
MISSWKRPSVRVAYSIVAIAYLVCASVIVADRFHRDVAPTCDDPMVGFSAIVGLGPILNLSLPGTQSLVLVPAFSNCNGNYQSNEDAVLANGSIAGPTQPVGSLPRVLQCLQSQFTGMAWQCVEFGRRYLLMSLNTTFGSVVGAADIYALPNATRMSMVSNNCGEIAEHVFPFDGFANGQLPLLRASDLIIYPRQQGFGNALRARRRRPGREARCGRPGIHRVRCYDVVNYIVRARRRTELGQRAVEAHHLLARVETDPLGAWRARPCGRLPPVDPARHGRIQHHRGETRSPRMRLQ